MQRYKHSFVFFCQCSLWLFRLMCVYCIWSLFLYFLSGKSQTNGIVIPFLWKTEVDELIYRKVMVVMVCQLPPPFSTPKAVGFSTKPSWGRVTWPWLCVNKADHVLQYTHKAAAHSSYAFCALQRKDGMRCIDLMSHVQETCTNVSDVLYICCSSSAPYFVNKSISSADLDGRAFRTILGM